MLRESARRTRSRFVVPAAVIAAGVVVHLPQLGHSLNEAHGFRQTQTAWVARSYAESGIDLRHTPLPVFGPGSDVPMETPIVQAIGALVMHLGVGSDVAMRIVGLVGFVAVSVLLVVLVTRWHGRRAALLSLVVLQVAPLSLAWGAASLIEFPAVALAMGMVASLDAWMRGGRWWLLPTGTVLAVLAFLVKATTAPVWCVLLLFAGLAVLRRGAVLRVVAGLAAAGVPGLVAAATWTRYADSVKAGSPLTAPLTSGALDAWNFGTLSQRLDADVWLTVWVRISSDVLGTVPVVLVAGSFVVVGSRGAARLHTLGWWVTGFTGPLVFLHLYYVHSYYLVAVLPALAAVAGLTLDAALRRPRDRPLVRAGVVTALVVGLATVWATDGARASLSQLRHGQPEPSASAELAEVVPRGETVVMVGCDWDPSVAYYAQRDALYLWTDDPGAYWQTHDVERFHWLYRCQDVDPALFVPSGTRVAPTATKGLYTLG